MAGLGEEARTGGLCLGWGAGAPERPGGEEEEPRAGRLPVSSGSQTLGGEGSYVQGIVHLHYKTDEAVRDDLELQSWCAEITEVGLLGAQDRGEISPRLDLPHERVPLGTSPES